jgi:primosomal protein N' (replication factor Y)
MTSPSSFSADHELAVMIGAGSRRRAHDHGDLGGGSRRDVALVWYDGRVADEAELPGLTIPGVPPVKAAGPAPAKAAGAGKASKRRRAAEDRPVARVALDVSLPHLDRPFDYQVPAELDDAVVPGCRVRVRFAGRLVDGFVLDRADASAHPGTLAFLDKVVSAEPVLTAEVAALARAVADRYAGTLADVLRLAVPPRHARVEAAQSTVDTVDTVGHCGCSRAGARRGLDRLRRRAGLPGRPDRG